MSAILDVAIFGFIAFFIVAAIYSLLTFILLALYDAIKNSEVRMPAIFWPEVLKASVLSSALNNISVAILSTIIIAEIIQGGLSTPSPITQPSTPIGIAMFAMGSLTKIILLAVFSFIFWLIFSVLLTGFLIKNRMQQMEEGKRIIGKVTSDQLAKQRKGQIRIRGKRKGKR